MTANLKSPRGGIGRVYLLIAVALLITAGVGVAVVSARAPEGGVGGGYVVIDAGHGGKDPGTRSRSGLREKDVTLAIAEALAADLRSRGVMVVLTRTRDTFITLDRRVEIANQHRARLFVSIHCDDTTDHAIHGFTVLTASGASSRSLAAGRQIARQLTNTGIARHGVRSDDRGLRVLDGTRSPAVLVETGYLSNKSESALLGKSGYQEKVAGAIADGVMGYLSRN